MSDNKRKASESAADDSRNRILNSISGDALSHASGDVEADRSTKIIDVYEEDDGPPISPAHDYRRRRGIKECLQDASRTEGGHYPIQYLRKDNGKDFRRKCRWCNDFKSSVYCMHCGVALCIRNVKGTNCWKEFHEAPLSVEEGRDMYRI
mmetsp:Transcript_14079/g.21050  ORF Transcript_14079/g.21050 Transcript_14079/m.21050 type:complete len:150 (-) Transcript_14079:40-489(-)